MANMWSSLNYYILLVGLLVGGLSLENYLSVSSKVKNMHILLARNSTLRFISNRNTYAYQKTCIKMSINVLFIIDPNQKQLKCS